MVSRHSAGARTRIALLCGLVLSCVAAPVRPAGWDDDPIEPGGRLPVTAERLLSLADFGQGDNGAYQGPGFGISPNGERLALVVRRADPTRNQFRQSLIIVARRSKVPPRVIPLDVQPLHRTFALRGLLTPNGVIAANPPRWSPDGKSIAILAPKLSTTQVLAISLASGHAKFLTAAPAGVVDFAWAPDGRTLTYSTRAGLPAFHAAVERESMQGYHYDDRVTPLMSARPQPPASLPLSYVDLSLVNGREHAAASSERRLLAPDQSFLDPPEVAITAMHARARLVRQNPDDLFSPITLSGTVRGKPVDCGAAACSGYLTNLWASADGFLYLRREGWGESMTALYRWHPGSSPQRLLATDDLLAGCDVVDTDFICAREGSLQPRRLWSFDTVARRQTILFDPNPRFQRLELPRVRRLHWTGPFEAEGFGDLIVPARAAPQRGYPLVVVSYRTRGFKRGAIGDEYPILPFAAHGIAVLSIENLPDYASLVGRAKRTSPRDAGRLDTIDDHERQLQLDNMLAGLAASKAVAPIDSARLGIAGVSDAASSAIYAIVNTNKFAVASLGSPGLDSTTFALGGPALRHSFAEIGYPMTGAKAQTFYKSNALLPNAARMKVPLLLQYPEDEYLTGLATIAALEDAGAPVDAYVFPGEHHVKSQPAHRLAIYRRNIAWFDFWLRGEAIDGDDTRLALARWRAMKAHLCTVPTRSDGAPIQLCTHASASTNSVTR